jgi:hypothetical protein
MRGFMNEVRQKYARPGEPVMIAGDFNVDMNREGRHEHRAMLDILNAIGPTPDGVATNPKGEWLDYVLYPRDLSPAPTLAFNSVRQPKGQSIYPYGDLSDHYAVLGRFGFDLPPPPPEICGNGVCAGAETLSSCAEDCTVHAVSEAPTLLHPVGMVQGSEQTFVWTPVPHADAYHITVVDGATGQTMFDDTVPELSCQSEVRFAAGREYRWSVAGRRGTQEGPVSVETAFSTDGVDPPLVPPSEAPVALGPTGYADGDIQTFSWRGSPTPPDIISTCSTARRAHRSSVTSRTRHRTRPTRDWSPADPTAGRSRA